MIFANRGRVPPTKSTSICLRDQRRLQRKALHSNMESLLQCSSSCPSTNIPNSSSSLRASASLPNQNAQESGDNGSEALMTEWVLQTSRRMEQESTLPVLRFIRKPRRKTGGPTVNEPNRLKKHTEIAKDTLGKEILHEVPIAQRMKHASDDTTPTPIQKTGVVKPEPIEETLLDAGTAEQKHSWLKFHSVWSPIMQKKKEECLALVASEGRTKIPQRSHEGRNVAPPRESGSAGQSALQADELFDAGHDKRDGIIMPDVQFCHPREMPGHKAERKRAQANTHSAPWRIPDTDRAHSESVLNENVRLTHQGIGALKCDVDGCGSKFGSKGALKTHNKIVHGNIPFVECDVPGCGKILTGKLALLNLARHKEAVHERNPTVQCDARGCGRVLKCFTTYLRHRQMVHEKRTRSRCDFPGCGKILKSSRYLANHKSAAHGSFTPVPCDIPGCGKVLKTSRYYEKHKETVHGSFTPIPCEIPGCGTILKASRYYFRHKETVHGNVRPVKCDFPGCGRVLKSLRYYGSHKKAVHGNFAPIQCDVPECGRELKTARSYARHKQVVHGSIPPIQCEVFGCGKVLKSARYYANHKETVHGSIKPVRCEMAGCGKVLKCFAYYVRHKRNVHGVNHAPA